MAASSAAPARSSTANAAAWLPVTAMRSGVSPRSFVMRAAREAAAPW